MIDYFRVVGDTDGPIEDQLLADGSAVDITGYNRVAIHIEKPDGTTVIDTTAGAVTVDDAGTGKVTYELQAGDLDTVGRYFYEWEVEFADGGVLSFGGEDRGEIYVRDEIA